MLYFHNINTVGMYKKSAFRRTHQVFMFKFEIIYIGSKNYTIFTKFKVT